jgi:hypothetical protein
MKFNCLCQAATPGRELNRDDLAHRPPRRVDERLSELPQTYFVHFQTSAEAITRFTAYHLHQLC